MNGSTSNPKTIFCTSISLDGYVMVPEDDKDFLDMVHKQGEHYDYREFDFVIRYNNEVIKPQELPDPLLPDYYFFLRISPTLYRD